MSAAITAAVIVGGASVYSANKSASASRDATNLIASGEEAQLQFQREQFDRWNSIYGDLEKNLGEFYTNLTPDYMESQGLQAQQTAFQTGITRLKEQFAQTGVEGGAQADILARAELNNAKTKAQIRADAPFKVAEQKSSFLSLGMGQGQSARNGVTNAMDRTGTANAMYKESDAYNTMSNELANTAGTLVYNYGKNQALADDPDAPSGTANGGTK